MAAVEDLAGSVWEWTRSLRDNEQGEKFGVPYRPRDGREQSGAGWMAWRVLRGGSWYSEASGLGCGVRNDFSPLDVNWLRGVRVVASPLAVGR